MFFILCDVIFLVRLQGKFDIAPTLTRESVRYCSDISQSHKAMEIEEV